MDEILKTMIKAASLASAKVMEIYESGFKVQIKGDYSPVTDADLASDKIIRETLSVFSDISFLSEEEEDDLTRLKKRSLFVVDPLDGTQDFVNQDGSFGINIAFVVDHEPVLAVIALPACHQIAYAIKNEGSYLIDKDGTTRRIHVSDRKSDLIFLSSKTHELEEEKQVYLKHASLIKEVVRYGASEKAVRLAMGEADASIRYTDQTKEWDVCAPDLLVREAGGIFADTKLNPFRYNREDVYNHDGYCMFNRAENTILLK